MFLSEGGFAGRPPKALASTEMAVNLAVNVQFSPLHCIPGANKWVMAADRVTVRRLCSGKREGSRRA
jgi:hypothetical protein